MVRHNPLHPQRPFQCSDRLIPDTRIRSLEWNGRVGGGPPSSPDTKNASMCQVDSAGFVESIKTHYNVIGLTRARLLAKFWCAAGTFGAGGEGCHRPEPCLFCIAECLPEVARVYAWRLVRVRLGERSHPAPLSVENF